MKYINWLTDERKKYMMQEKKVQVKENNAIILSREKEAVREGGRHIRQSKIVLESIQSDLLSLWAF